MHLSFARVLCTRAPRPKMISTAVLSITLLLFASSAVSADAAVGLGVSDGDHRLMWLETNDWSVSREIANQYDERWNTREEDLSDLNYDTYVKSFRWYMVFERKF